MIPLQNQTYLIRIFFTTKIQIPKEKKCSAEYLFQGHETESEGEDFILLTERYQINHPRNNEPNVFITTTTGHINAFFGWKSICLSESIQGARPDHVPSTQSKSPRPPLIYRLPAASLLQCHPQPVFNYVNGTLSKSYRHDFIITIILNLGT